MMRWWLSLLLSQTVDSIVDRLTEKSVLYNDTIRTRIDTLFFSPLQALLHKRNIKVFLLNIKERKKNFRLELNMKYRTRRSQMS